MIANMSSIFPRLVCLFAFSLGLVFGERTVLAEGARPTFKIGVIIPLSGELAFVGEDVKAGLTLASEELKDSPYDYQFVFEDNRFQLKDSVVAASRLINVEHVNLLISLWDAADVIAPLAERSKTVHFSIRWNPDVAANNHYTFTIESTYRQYAQSQLNLLHALKVRRVALINSADQGNTLGADELERLIKADGTLALVSRDTFNPGTTDFRTMLARALKESPDILVNYTWPPDTQLLLKQYRELKSNGAHTGYYEVLEDLSTIEGQPSVGQFEATPEFKAHFQKRF